VNLRDWRRAPNTCSGEFDNGNIDGSEPKAAVLMIGTNNSGSNTPEEIADGIKAIVAKLRTKLPETKILVLAIFPAEPTTKTPAARST
jgi:beta-glucosidase